MCIICVKPAGAPIWDDKTIKNCFDANPHGAGIAYWSFKDKCVKLTKGFFDVNEVLEFLHKHQKTLEKTNVILHFRIMTSGKKDAMNCHPYPVFNKNFVKGSTSIAVAHNGILDSYGFKPELGSEINDTQVFINKCLKKLPHNFLKNEAICTLIGNGIGTNKLAFISENGVRMIGNFQKETKNGSDYYYSNDSYKPRDYSWLNYGRKWNYPTRQAKDTKANTKTSVSYQTSLLDKDDKKYGSYVFEYPGKAEFKVAIAELEKKAKKICQDVYRTTKFEYRVFSKDLFIEKVPLM